MAKKTTTETEEPAPKPKAKEKPTKPPKQLPDIFIDPREVELAKTSLNIALRSLQGELNPKSENEAESFQGILSQAGHRLKRDNLFNDSVLKAQLANQPVDKAATELSETVALFLEVFLNDHEFGGSFVDFYLRGVKRKAYKFNSVSKTLTELTHPLRLLGSYFKPGMYFDVVAKKPKDEKDEVAGVIYKTVSANELSERLEELEVFSCIVKTKDHYFVTARDESGFFIVLDYLRPDVTGQPLTACTDTVEKAFGFFKRGRKQFTMNLL